MESKTGTRKGNVMEPQSDREQMLSVRILRTKIKNIVLQQSPPFVSNEDYPCGWWRTGFGQEILKKFTEQQQSILVLIDNAFEQFIKDM